MCLQALELWDVAKGSYFLIKGTSPSQQSATASSNKTVHGYAERQRGALRKILVFM